MHERRRTVFKALLLSANKVLDNHDIRDLLSAGLNEKEISLLVADIINMVSKGRNRVRIYKEG